MKRIDKDSLAAVEFSLRWQSHEGVHTDTSLRRVNFWRDFMPDELRQGLMGASVGSRREFRFSPREGLGVYDSGKKHRLKRGQFDEKRARPKYGRFYPKGILKDFYHVFPQNVEPVRCIGVTDGAVAVDLNHPMAGRNLELTAVVHEVMEKPFDRGGQSRSVMEALAEGPGMQARYEGEPTDFSGTQAFRRGDESPDALFYEKPRLVTHIDDQAIATISSLYGRFLDPDMNVLDLMSSWRSHVPAEKVPARFVGLGMNASEMKENNQLTEHHVHDLNEQPRLPFADAAFDRVICSVSVEYMTRPVAVFMETARILKPGGMLIHTFSNRWFPPKAVRLWTELHEFERMGLVLEYFQQAGAFTDLETFSSRGWDRPETDRYYPERPDSDPVFAVWGTRRR